jgi:Lrp/AsnC family leucine-responsive transcriptional regulator
MAISRGRDDCSGIRAQQACVIAQPTADRARLLRPIEDPPVNATATFDRIDLLLLAELQRAGRLTNAELAERVHLSPSASLRRVQRLEREGVIAGYRAEVDPAKLGLDLTAFVRVQLTRHDAAAIEAFSAAVNAWDEVIACHALTGDMDYLLHVVVRDLEHFSRFLLDRLLGQAGVADVNSSFVLRTVKAFRGLPLPRG